MTLTANSNGEITGSFTIPANVPAGTKPVLFIGEVNRGAAQFTGTGTEISRIQRQIVNNVWRFEENPGGYDTSGITAWGVDPLAQTFRLDEGRHITSAEFQFKAKGSNSNPVYLQIRETELGLPNSSVLAEGVLSASSIQLTGWTKISLSRPVYLAANVEYAIVLLTDDAAHAVAIAELGKRDAATQAFVTSQPYTVGTLLKSSNASTWTPIQEADLTFRLYGANFTSTTRTVALGQIRTGSVTITRSGSTATATMSGGHPFVTGQKVVHSGANQSEYNAAFEITSTGANTYTFTVSGSPATPATGTIYAVAGATSDLLALAGVERINSNTDVEFILTKPDGSIINAAPNAPVRLVDDVNVPMTLSAILRGTSKIAPFLFAGVQLVYGNQAETGNYVSRAVPCAAGAKVSATFETILSGGSSVLVEFQKSDGTWQTVSLTSSSAVGDGWSEQNYTVSSFIAGGTTTRIRLTLTGTAAARPLVRQLRLVVI